MKQVFNLYFSLSATMVKEACI